MSSRFVQSLRQRIVVSSRLLARLQSATDLDLIRKIEVSADENGCIEEGAMQYTLETIDHGNNIVRREDFHALGLSHASVRQLLALVVEGPHDGVTPVRIDDGVVLSTRQFCIPMLV